MVNKTDALVSGVALSLVFDKLEGFLLLAVVLYKLCYCQCQVLAGI